MGRLDIVILAYTPRTIHNPIFAGFTRGRLAETSSSHCVTYQSCKPNKRPAAQTTRLQCCATCWSIALLSEGRGCWQKFISDLLATESLSWYCDLLFLCQAWPAFWCGLNKALHTGCSLVLIWQAYQARSILTSLMRQRLAASQCQCVGTAVQVTGKATLEPPDWDADIQKTSELELTTHCLMMFNGYCCFRLDQNPWIYLDQMKQGRPGKIVRQSHKRKCKTFRAFRLSMRGWIVWWMHSNWVCNCMNSKGNDGNSVFFRTAIVYVKIKHKQWTPPLKKESKATDGVT